MGLKWLSRKFGVKPSAAIGKKKAESEFSFPISYRCPISLELMKDPVTLSTGITYDRESIERWLELGNTTCPVSNEELRNGEVIPNHALRKIIQDWCVANRAFGIDRIPTPKVPITHVQAAEMLSEIAEVSCRGEFAKCKELMLKFKRFVKESEKNRNCFISSDASSVLAASFSTFASGYFSGHFSNNELLKEILSALCLVLPLSEVAMIHIGSTESLNSLSLILKHGDLSEKLNVLFVLKELLASSAEHVGNVTRTEGIIEALAEFIKVCISPQITKASLLAIFDLVNSNEKTAMQYVDLGMIPVLLNILVEPEKSLSQRALAVYDALLNYDIGRVDARGNALSIPILVKKMFRVSDLATAFAVSALLKLCKNSNGEDDVECIVEALQVGAFQKLLLLLQIGCSEATKEKATELIKLLNGYRDRAECTETVDFKELKRPF